MGITSNPFCKICGIREDTVEHTFFDCPNTEAERQQIFSLVGPFSASSVVSKMLESEDKWKAIALFVENILRKKKHMGLIDDEPGIPE